MCWTEREHGAKAKAISDTTDEKFSADWLPYANCIALRVDNASTMVGVNNSVTSRSKY